VRSAGAQSTPRAQQTPTSSLSSSTSPDPTLASLLPRKTRSLRNIYNVDTTNSFSVFSLFSQIDDPLTFEEVVKDDVWAQAMDEEIECIENNQTWKLVDVPEDKDVISVKWIYKTKQDADGNVQKHKERLVARGFTQQPGIDFNETFAPVAWMDTVRTVLAIVAHNKWHVYQMDVKSTFLNGHLEEEVYVEQPQGYEIPGQENKVYRLKKALYGLKQAPRAWYSHIDSYLTQNGFQRSDCEPTLYIKANQQGNMLIVFLYVDDLIFTGDFGIEEFKSVMKDEFEMTDLGLMRYFLGIEVHQSKAGIFISQSKYAHEILKRFNMINSKATPTPVITGLKLSKEDEGSKVDPTLFKRLVGSLMYLTTTRPDIMYGVSLISRFMETPKESHWKAGKRILRYVNGTKYLALCILLQKILDLLDILTMIVEAT
jgi:hypothetical protein